MSAMPTPGMRDATYLRRARTGARPLALASGAAAGMRWALDDAAQARTPLVIVRLDTAGGLKSSMREIVQRITAAPMPAVVFVSPDGRAPLGGAVSSRRRATVGRWKA